MAAILWFATGYSYAQRVNAYAKVTGIAGGTVLSLSHIDETGHTFKVDEEVIVMQMQDNVIGTNTNDDANFGNLFSVRSAGLYEVRTITAKTASTVTLHMALDNTYNFTPNSSVQVISYRRLGKPDFTTTSVIEGPAWDGNIGGVVAIKVLGKLTLKHAVSMNGRGFQNGRESGTPSTCPITWRTNTTALSGQKGDGIYKSIDTQFSRGRGKILNGGGGGNSTSAGGGGGGNFSAGGDGARGGGCGNLMSENFGGRGGIALSTVSTSGRAFMGGGGGAGTQVIGSSATGAGGGIILIAAEQIVVSACGLSISANGSDGSNSLVNLGPGKGTISEGAWGGGAGGTIVLKVEKFEYAAAQTNCPLTVSANGGNGGGSQRIGGGGAGGQGRIVYTRPLPTNVTTTTNIGLGGCNNRTCTMRTATPPGVNGAGISSNVNNTPLPVKLLYFSGAFDKSTNTIHIQWTTLTEYNNSHFTVERSTDGIHFSSVAMLAGQADSKQTRTYQWEDENVYESRYYYRLVQTDLDGKQEYFHVIVVNADRDMPPEIYIYPNPALAGETLCVDFVGVPKGQYLLQIIGMDGRQVMRQELFVASAFKPIVLTSQGIKKGIYTMILSSEKYTQSTKILFR